MYRKKALDFERKLAFKVMKSFFPSFNSKIGDFSISIVFKNPGTIIDKFFNYYYYKEKLYFVYFHLEKTNPSLSIFLPALNAVLQYASLSGCTIQESVEKCRSVLQNKFMMDEKVEISLFSVNPEGLLEMSTPRDGSFMLLHENRNILEIFPENKIRLDKKNVLIICNSIIHEIIIYNQELILNILNKDTGLSEKNIELIQFIRKNFLISDSFHFLFLINYDK